MVDSENPLDMTDHVLQGLMLLSVFVLQKGIVALDIRPSLNRVLSQLQSERARIDRQIAALAGALDAIGGGAAKGTRAAAKRVAKRARPKMTAAQRRAVSSRMTKYWAERRKKAKD